MPKPSATTPFHLIYGGDPYLNEQTVRDLRHQAQRKHPRRGNHRTRRNQRRSLRLRRSGKPITALRTINRHRIQPAKRRRQTRRNHGRLLQASRQQSSRSQHRHLPTRRRHQRQTTHRPNSPKPEPSKKTVADLKKSRSENSNFTIQCFERRNRRIEPMAAQQLVAVLGDKTGELAAWQDNSASTSTTIP